MDFIDRDVMHLRFGSRYIFKYFNRNLPDVFIQFAGIDYFFYIFEVSMRVVRSGQVRVISFMTENFVFMMLDGRAVFATIFSAFLLELMRVIMIVAVIMTVIMVVAVNVVVIMRVLMIVSDMSMGFNVIAVYGAVMRNALDNSVAVSFMAVAEKRRVAENVSGTVHHVEFRCRKPVFSGFFGFERIAFKFQLRQLVFKIIVIDSGVEKRAYGHIARYPGKAVKKKDLHLHCLRFYYF